MNYRFLGIVLLTMALATRAISAEATDYLANAESLLGKGQLRAAEIQLKNAVRADPKNMVAHYRLAFVQLQLGEAAAAEHEANAARAGGYDPEHVTPLLAEAYLAQRKYRQLLQDFAGDEGSTAERASVFVARGYAQIALGQVQEARSSFAQAQTLAPQEPQPLLGEAKLLMAERQFAAAATTLDRVLSLDPKSSEARLSKAHVLRVNGDPGQALSILDQVLADAPGHLPARLERAEILLSQGDERAKADIDAALATQPGSVTAIYLEAVFAAKNKDFQKAILDLQKISGALPSIPRGYYVQAFVNYNLRQLDQAADAARRYAARNPDDLSGQKLLGAIVLAQGRPAEVVDALGKFASEGSADAGALDLLGRAYTQLGKTGDAAEAFAGAVKLAPQDAALRMRLGVSRLRAGDTGEAVAELEQSLELAPSVSAGETLVMTELAAGHWEEAVAAAGKLQQAQSDSPVAGNLMGLVALARFKLDDARDEFAKLASKYPDFLPAHLNLARVLELKGRPEDAAEILSKIVTQQPGAGLALTRLVDLLLRSGKADAAVTAVEHAHAAVPANLGITVGLIDLYIRLGHKDQALELARQEKGSNNQSDVPLIAARSRAELAAGLKNEAAQTYRRQIEITPSRTDYRRQLAAVLLSTNDFDGARHVIDQALEIEPRNSQLALDRIAIELKASGLDEAIATAEKIQKKNPELPTAPALIGDTYMTAGEHTKAADAYAKAMQQSPSAMVALRLAQAKSAAGSVDAAASILREWYSKHPNDNAVTAMLATYDLAARRFDEATKELEKVVETMPRDPVVLNNLAWLYQQSGDPRARSLAERAYLLAPNQPQTADTLGWILVQQGQAETAVGLLTEASAAANAGPAIRYHLAVALKDIGQRAQARQLLDELINRSGTFDDKPAAEKLLAELSKG